MQHNSHSVITRNEKETAYIGETLGKIIEPPMVIALKGSLGAGKTVFVRGAAKGLGVIEQVTSPTFVLLKNYHGRFPVYHFDYYRLYEADLEEAIGMGFEDYLPGDGIAFVEWAERLPSLIPTDFLEIFLELYFDNEGERRRLTFVAHGYSATLAVKRLFSHLKLDTDRTLKF